MDDNVINLKSDAQSKEDHLGFDQYIETLNEMIRSKKFRTPFCIGIYGRWGSGKTTFMELMAQKLQEDHTKPRIIPVRFNPWRYTREEHLIIPFLKTIEQTITSYIDKGKIGKRKIGKNFWINSESLREL